MAQTLHRSGLCYAAHMLHILIVVTVIAFGLKIISKNSERKSAEKISLTLAHSNQAEMIEMLRKMVPQHTMTRAMVEAICGKLFYIAIPLSWLFELLHFSTVAVDARTVSPAVLWYSRYELLDLHDRDTLDALGHWEEAVRKDVLMLVILLVSIATLLITILEK